MSEEQAQLESEPSQFEENLSAYRQSLITTEQTMQSEYDKAVITLSGGALGISFAFLKQIFGTKELQAGVLHHGGCLLLAWGCWAMSISVMLASYFTSTKAFRNALEKTDDQTIYLTLAKSRWATATKWMNAIGGITFFLGVIFLIIFVSLNLPQ